MLEVQGAGAELKMDHGAVLTVGNQGSLFVRQGATAQVRGTVSNDGAMALGSGAVVEVSGRIDNNGMLQVRGAGTELRLLSGTAGGLNAEVLRNLDQGVIDISESAVLQVQGWVNIKGEIRRVQAC